MVPPLAGRVSAFEKHDDPLPGFAHPFLDLQQLDLQLVLVLFVLDHPHLFGVRVGAVYVPSRRLDMRLQVKDPPLRPVGTSVQLPIL